MTEQAHAVVERLDPVTVEDFLALPEPLLMALEEGPQLPFQDSTDGSKRFRSLEPNKTPTDGCTINKNPVVALNHPDMHLGDIPITNEEEQLKDYANMSIMEEDSSSLPYVKDGMSMIDNPYMESSGDSTSESNLPAFPAFAKLQFADADEFMRTYAVWIGKDIEAFKLAKREDFEAKQKLESVPLKRSSSSGDACFPPRKLQSRKSRSIACSIVSGSGGIMGLDMHLVGATKKRKAGKSYSTSSSSYKTSRKSSLGFMAAQTGDQSLAGFATPADALSHLPSPHECPMIKIHPPKSAGRGTLGFGGISRTHAKIAYNFEKQLFEVEVFGRNGLWVNEVHFAAGEIHELRNGDVVQIGGVTMRFLLPNIALGETGPEFVAESEVGAMSFEFEDGRGESIVDAGDDSIDSSSSSDDNRSNQGPEEEDYGNDVPNRTEDNHLESGCEELAVQALRDHLQHKDTLNNDSENEEGANDEDENIKETISNSKRRHKLRREAKPKSKPKTKPNPEPKVEALPAQPKRKGPGRPPKGLISKRELAEQVRKAKEAAKLAALANGRPQAAVGTDGQPGNDVDSKSPQPDGKPVKRKYTKRKKTENQLDESSNIRDSIEQTESVTPNEVPAAVPSKPPKEKKPVKPARSPSPVWDITKYTEEQLQRPSQSYVVLIHEALSNSPTGAMSLPQIYRAIMIRYPFYKFKTGSTGWQSSVRHNLSGHPAFNKIERDGKGWMWGLDRSISIEKNTKRRPSPPVQAQQAYIPGQPQPVPQYYTPQWAPAPINGQLPIGFPAYTGQPELQLPPLGFQRNPNGHPLALATPLGTTESTYRSPYQPAPQSQAPVPTPSQTSSHPTLSSHAVAGEGSRPSQTPSTVIQPPSRPVHRPDPSPPPNFYRSPPRNRTPPPRKHASPPRPPAGSSPGELSPDVLNAISAFKGHMIKSMSTIPNVEKVIESAINRVLGNQPTCSGPISPPEQLIMNALSDMLKKIKNAKEEKAQQQQQQSTMANPLVQPIQQQQPSLPPSYQAPTPQEASSQQQRPAQSPTPGPPQPTPAATAQLQQWLEQFKQGASPSSTQSQNLANSNAAVPSTTNAVSPTIQNGDVPHGLKRKSDEEPEEQRHLSKRIAV